MFNVRSGTLSLKLISLSPFILVLVSIVLVPSVVTHFTSVRWSVRASFLLEVLWGLFSDLKHFLDEEFQYFVFFCNFELLNFLDTIELYMVWLWLHRRKFLLHLLELQNLFPLFYHYILLSLYHVIFAWNFLFKPLILSIKSLSNNFNWRPSLNLSNMPVTHCRCFLNIGGFFWKHCLFLISQARCNIWLIEHLLERALGLFSIVLYPLFHLNFSSKGLPFHTFNKIFLGFFNFFNWLCQGLFVLWNNSSGVN